MNNYNINFALFLKRLIPAFMRNTPNTNLIAILKTGIQSVHQLFLDFVSDKEVEKQTTGQTFLLENYLNYVFDRSQKRIYITHVDEIVEFDFMTSENQVCDYDYLDSENQPSTGVLYLTGEGNRNLAVDFLVFVPAAILATQTDRVRANIVKYKLAAKRFEFRTI